jgi:hypothetical protein
MGMRVSWQESNYRPLYNTVMEPARNIRGTGSLRNAQHCQDDLPSTSGRVAGPISLRIGNSYITILEEDNY